MSRFWAGAGSGSGSDDDDSDSDKSSNSSSSSSSNDNESSDDDSSSSSGDNNRGGAGNNAGGDRNNATGENRWLAFSDDEDSSDDDDARIVKSGKERAFEFFIKQTTQLRTAMKARDYYAIQTLFDDLAKAMIKAKAYLKTGVPRSLVRILVDLEDYIAERLTDKEQFKSLSARQSRALNRMKLTLKKHNKPYGVVIDAYRQNPDTPIVDDDDDDEDDDNAGGNAKASDDDDSSSSSSSSSSDSDDESAVVKSKGGKEDDSSDGSDSVRTTTVCSFFFDTGIRCWQHSFLPGVFCF
jgi:translation initiation factor 3 subunit C